MHSAPCVNPATEEPRPKTVNSARMSSSVQPAPQWDMPTAVVA